MYDTVYMVIFNMCYYCPSSLANGFFPSWIRLDTVVFKERFWNWPAENNLKGAKIKRGQIFCVTNDLIVEHWTIDEVMANLICRCVTVIYWTVHSKNQLKQSTRHKWFVLFVIVYISNCYNTIL